MDKLLAQLRRDEGERLKMYLDSVGKHTIGVGHNLDDKPISARASATILEDDVTEVMQTLLSKAPWIGTLDEARQGVLYNMAFNLGPDGLLGFKNTLALVKAGDYITAAKNMLLSKWATQVGPRATRLAEQMRTGLWQ